jgi:hypothetical protein
MEFRQANNSSLFRFQRGGAKMSLKRLLASAGILAATADWGQDAFPK